MLQVARLARTQLRDSAGLAIQFLSSQRNPDGGFRNRDGASDLYYTVFGIEALRALDAEVPFDSIVTYLRSFGEGDALDFVHLACLARAWADLPRERAAGAPRRALLACLEAHRAGDGGYNAAPGSSWGTAYACFLALGAYQDLGEEMREPHAMLPCLDALRARDGGYSNQPGAETGLTPPTAAAATLLRQLGQAPDPVLGRWLLARCHRSGGFFAADQSPIPDLLSTATALHALAGLGVPVDGVKEPCLDFIDSLWTNRGGFYGSWADDSLDCEYTYYALLALGHLSL
ncbi:MAG: hypothetical protein DMG07_18400 [Acidobacteria bacterium]|nr:MAG: hypothetical protein DMG07_18400 [Acidobacteriota bacterium]